MIVEDEGIVAKDLQFRLQTLGYEVPEIAATGKSALEKFCSLSPDLVLMDIMLRGEMNGIETATEMRRLQNIPIIYLTAYSDDATLEKAKVTDPFGYILKPFDERELHTTLEMAFYKHKMEKKLREREAWLKTTLSSIGDGVIATDTEGKITFINPAAEDLTGWNNSQALEKKIDQVFRIVDEETRDNISSPILKILREGVTVDLGTNTLLVSRHDKTIPIENSASPIRNDSGEIIGVVLVFKNITERRQSEQRLKDSEEQFRLVAETATDAIITIDTESMITFANNATEKVFGYSVDELMGKSLTKIMPEPYRKHHGKSFQSYLESNKKSIPWSGFELRGLHKSGNEFPFEISFGEYTRGSKRLFTGFIRDITERKVSERKIKVLAKFPEDNPNPVIQVGLDGKILYANEACLPLLESWKCKITEPIPELLYYSVKEVLKTGKSSHIRIKVEGKIFSFMVAPFPDIDSVYLYGRDITQQKLAEDELAAEKERLATTLRSIGDGVITTDTKGKVVLLNKMAENLTGYLQEEAEGKYLPEIFNIINEKTRQPCKNPVHRVLQTGEIIEISHQTVLIARDRTELLISDSAAPIRDKECKIIGVVLVFQDITVRKVLEAELSRAQKLDSLGVLAGGIAHDFNNILTGVLGNISLIKLSTNKKNPLLNRLQEAEKAALRARDLTQQLLTFGRGGAPIRISASLADLITDSATFALRGSNVKCEFLFSPEEISPVEIDPGQMSQVINNLVINSDQSMSEGGTIRIELENFCNDPHILKSLAKGNYVKLVISDEGIGIPNHLLGKVFDPYFTTRQKGNGLGLAICYSIIKNHDGMISVESEHGKGTKFIIYLPATFKPLKLRKQNLEKSPCVGKGKILFMDDEDLIRDVVSEMLPKLGYDFLIVKDGNEAIENYVKAEQRGKPFDAVIMDLTIPGGMGGKEAVKKVLGINPEARVIVASGYSNDPIMANYEAYGFCDRIIKPFRIQEFSEVLKNVLSLDAI